MYHASCEQEPRELAFSIFRVISIFHFYPQCRDNIYEAFEHVDQLIAEKQFKTLEQDFLSCADISHPDDTWFFTKNLGNFLDATVQYNEQIGGFTIASICQYMDVPSQTPYNNLIPLIRVKKKRSSLVVL